VYHNVRNRYYGANPLYPTGPIVLGKYISKDKCTLVNGYDKLLLNHKVVFNMYKKYRAEQSTITKHYSAYWKARAIYKELVLSEYTIVNINALPRIDTTVIPKKIFQTWSSLDIPCNMKAAISANKTAHTDYTFYLYSDNMCAKFISDHYNESVVNAFNSLVPGAFKADLWRYCVLYIHGGIYMDIKYQLVNNINLNELMHDDYFVKDRSIHFKNGNGIYNGFMIVKPRNRYLLRAIMTIVKNTRNKYYGHNPLYPTSPGLLSEIIPSTYQFRLRYDDIAGTNSIFMDDTLILKSYNSYRDEQKATTPTSYDTLWHQRKIYR